MFAVLFLSEFALQSVLRLEPGLPPGPVALLAEGQRAVIAECDALARAAGIEPGVTVPQALARCDRLIVRAAQPAAEAEAQAMLLAAAFSLSPAVEATAPGVCTIQVTALAPERRAPTLQAAITRLAEGGLTATGGIGATPLLALYAARRANSKGSFASRWQAGRAGPDHAPDCTPSSPLTTDQVLMVGEADGRSFLAPLPLSAAEPAPALAAIIAGWGIRTLGDFAALSKADIANRLGPAGVALWERCTGETDRPLRIVVPAATFAAQLDCEHELETIEPLLFILRRFVDRLALELNTAGLAAGSLELHLALSDETTHRHLIRLPQPSTQADLLFRTLSTYLDSLRTAAAIAGVKLTIEPTRVALRQEGLFDCALRDPHGFTETLARAAALVGSGRVGRPAPEDTHRPDAVQLQQPAEVIPPLSPRFELPPQGLALRRYRPPLPATVELAGRLPAYLWTGAARGTVRDCDGPWYSSGDWWQTERQWEREEWDIELEAGGLYRLVRTPAGWWLEGEYD